MKQTGDTEKERRPFELTQKIEEMKKVKKEIKEAVKINQVKDEKRVESEQKHTLREVRKAVMKKKGAEPIPLKIKKTHSLGDFYGRFHPSKSKKGIKRSE